MKEWSVRLKGEKFDLQELPRLLFSPELTVIEQDGNYYLKSEDFNSMTDASHVLAASKPILEAINGALQLSLGDFQIVKADGILVRIGEHEKPLTQVLLPSSITCRARVSASVTLVKPNGTVDSSQRSSRVKSWIDLARQNKNVAHAFRLFCAPTWFNLYKIYEIIRADVGGEKKIIEKGWVTAPHIKRFTQTAQSPDVLGDDARHGIQKNQPPKKPMSLSEATSFIQALLKNWLQSGVKS